MRIFIIGQHETGKSAAALYLAQALQCEHAETGRVVIGELAKFYAAGSRNPDALVTWQRMIGVAKREFRDELLAIGDLMTRLSPACLIDECCKRASIVVGVRRRSEVFGYLNNGDFEKWDAVWIKIVGGRAKGQDATFQLHDQPCDFVVVNDGALIDLHRKMFDVTV
ncbi:MAG: hypothetical protein H0U60_12185 [Blastocatellia bacterium]|nr:hypothetical protein [Blastocatellia bacterium]